MRLAGEPEFNPGPPSTLPLRPRPPPPPDFFPVVVGVGDGFSPDARGPALDAGDGVGSGGGGVVVVVVVGVVVGAVDGGAECFGSETSVGGDAGIVININPTPTATTRLATTRIAVELSVLARSQRIAETAGLSTDALLMTGGLG